VTDNVDKCCIARQATDDNKISARAVHDDISKATDIHSAYITLFALARSQCLCEHITMLGYT